jgi:hypothetical protein
MSNDARNTARPRHPMPPLIRLALARAGLVNAYRSRPAYQQNDYIGWITSAVREETREKRLRQMLDELKEGGRYMGMAYRRPNARTKKTSK